MEEYLVVRERVPISTERTPDREPGTYENHAPVVQAHNDSSSANSQEIPVSIDNVRPEGTENQHFTYPSGEALGVNVHVRRSKRIKKSPHWYDQ